MKLIANNKKAYHDYFVIDTYEAGIELKGTEVKSIKLGSCSIKEAICRIINNEAYIFGMHVSPYFEGNIFNVDSERIRKLLLHRKQIFKINEELNVKGNTLIPLKVYLNKNIVKVEIGLCKGKKLYDKRETIKTNELKRNLSRDFKQAQLKI